MQSFQPMSSVLSSAAAEGTPSHSAQPTPPTPGSAPEAPDTLLPYQSAYLDELYPHCKAALCDLQDADSDASSVITFRRYQIIKEICKKLHINLSRSTSTHAIITGGFINQVAVVTWAGLLFNTWKNHRSLFRKVERVHLKLQAKKGVMGAAMPSEQEDHLRALENFVGTIDLSQVQPGALPLDYPPGRPRWSISELRVVANLY